MSTATPSEDRAQPESTAAAEGEAQKLLDRLRSAPAEEILADLFSTLLSAAQVKLGRRDARLFIDLCAETVSYARPHLPDELTKQVDSALGQLRLAQVSAESAVSPSDEPEVNDLKAVPRPPTEQDPGAAG
jgi:hypothetical protein